VIDAADQRSAGERIGLGDPLGADDALGRRLSRHLIGEEPLPEELARWRSAIELCGAALTRERDRRLWALIRRAPWLTGVVDAGLAWSDPHSPVRHRLCLLLAILEASPHHTRRFLPADYPRIALVALAARMIRAAFRLALGLVLVRTAAAVWPR
jgi:hypothetical protein